MPKFKVTVYEAPYDYTVEADNASEAEAKVISNQWGGNYDCIGKIIVEEVK